jgi:hypothetical protein
MRAFLRRFVGATVLSALLVGGSLAAPSPALAAPSGGGCNTVTSGGVTVRACVNAIAATHTTYTYYEVTNTSGACAYTDWQFFRRPPGSSTFAGTAIGQRGCSGYYWLGNTLQPGDYYLRVIARASNGFALVVVNSPILFHP